MKPWLALLLAATAAATAACKGEPNEGKQMPRLAPPPASGLPAELHIAVEGAALPAITAATLAGRPADFADEERKAWKLGPLLGVGEDAVVVAHGASDAAVVLPVRSAGGEVAVLMLSRRGDVLARMLDEKTPFPAFHGQGGRLGRTPDDEPRVARVSRLVVQRQ
jgi:hypothetical protein